MGLLTLVFCKRAQKHRWQHLFLTCVVEVAQFCHAGFRPEARAVKWTSCPLCWDLAAFPRFTHTRLLSWPTPAQGNGVELGLWHWSRTIEKCAVPMVRADCLAPLIMLSDRNSCWLPCSYSGYRATPALERGSWPHWRVRTLKAHCMFSPGQ